MAALEGVPGVVDLTVFGAGLHVRLEDEDDPVRAVQQALASAGVEILSAEAIRPSLEDAFLYLTGASAERTAVEAR